MNSRSTVSRGWLAIIIMVAILVVDQIIKIWVKTHMTLHEQIEIFSWFKFVFIENNGMAYGMEIGSKLFLSILRIVAIAFLGYIIALQVKKKASTGFVVCLAMVFSGALGNVLDSMFYGLVFNASSEYYVSYFVPFGEGYAPFLMGKVVDMFYFPLIVTVWPDWVPVLGGNDFVFFSPVFNFADASISVAVVLLLILYRKELGEITWQDILKNKDAKSKEVADEK